MTAQLSLYNACVPILVRIFENLEHVLRKGEANANERGIEADIFLNARLAPDMATLTRQIQFATSLGKNCPHRLAGTNPPVFEDTETSFEELYALLAKTRAEISSFTPDTLDGRENSTFTVKLGPNNDAEFTSIAYLSGFTLPNVYFHCTTAYNILRSNGVPLGKLDFFGGKR